MDPTDDFVLPYTLESPSFDLGVESTQPDILHSEDIQKHIDSVISDVVTTIKTVDTEVTPTAELTSELLVKWVLRPVKILQSPFVDVEGKLFKHDNIVVFKNYKGRVDEVDSSKFMALFQRGYKPRTNHDCGIFVILYALYILRDNRESIPYIFDASKCRMDIATLLYKHREMYVKRVRQSITGEGIVIE
ncbi:Hypothetical predicted protein [Olea europaea subsp. europaea]|uniref:Ubiquitin-like protease family profile domain-containing protein n=1 Tax=Olea europaea subsp. europaea TaxID=158383 RepID=A0A8S0PDY4_OLEEU|nr:Hypothetical predicted protein [Olea europaea subsp. europaea]